MKKIEKTAAAVVRLAQLHRNGLKLCFLVASLHCFLCAHYFILKFKTADAICNTHIIWLHSNPGKGNPPKKVVDIGPCQERCDPPAAAIEGHEHV